MEFQGVGVDIYRVIAEQYLHLDFEVVFSFGCCSRRKISKAPHQVALPLRETQDSP
jgi:hypothetical protein